MELMELLWKASPITLQRDEIDIEQNWVQFVGVALHISPSFTCGPFGELIAHPSNKLDHFCLAAFVLCIFAYLPIVPGLWPLEHDS